MALAPDRTGIGIRRYFTTEGVDPYEQVEWERRDARITNYTDGSVAFEQTGVEFPKGWSQNATNIVAQKYFRGHLGSPDRESSLKEMADRVVDTITAWGVQDGYFVDDTEAETFRAELKHLIITQKASFNSPVWFNIGAPGRKQQASACFILAVDDTMDSILNWYVEEGTIFKGGSGSGINLSRIRSSYEPLKGGGTASGPVSFMRGADASAGTIKSGGATRRAAKMVILNADHPDIEDFIWCKAVEERKARVLRDAGFDMDLDGKDSHSTQYQNANNSVRVTDEFMAAVLDDSDWHLRAVTTGEVVKTVKARELFRQIAEAAWDCADPGMQFDTTINRWHTAAATGRINGSNPCCFVGDTLVVTADGLIPIAELEAMSASGKVLPFVVAYDEQGEVAVSREVIKAWVAGRTNRLVEVATASGSVMGCTPEHRFLCADGRYVEAQELTPGTELRGASVPDRVVGVQQVELDHAVSVYDIEVEGTHNFAVCSSADAAAVIVHNSEYMHLDNSACNLASLNLLKFLDDETNTFDVEGYKAAVEVVFTAQEILVGNADYPTESIAETSRRFRQLGLGYANLGALLMALGLPYDSEEGRAWAAALTSLMTGHAYAVSARTAGRMGPFAGYAENAEHMLNVLRMHRAEAAKIDEELVPTGVLSAAQKAWDDAVELGEAHGVRNSQASVLAPTGCLVGGTLVPTERGLARLGSLGDPDGDQWQDLGIAVQTDEGPRTATQFYVNGLEEVVEVTTSRGHRVKGTTKHRVKVVDEHGQLVWRRFADLRPGDVVPLALDQLVGEPQTVSLPPLPEGYWTGEHGVRGPREMTPELAELLGYFMGDGSLHTKGIRLCVASSDFDVVEHLLRLGKSLFGLEGHVTETGGYTEVAFHSVRLTQWWEACGFAKHAPTEDHSGKGWHPHIPAAVLYSNDREVYAAFLRGLFEADGKAVAGYPAWDTACIDFTHEVQSLMLALGYPTTRRFNTSGRGSRMAELRLLNRATNARWLDEIGFLSGRKRAAIDVSEAKQGARYDHIPVTRELIDRVVPDNGRERKVALMEWRRTGSITRRLALEIQAQAGDPELAHLLRFYFDSVALAELAGEELTYDLSVPDNVTYVANGFISHNTIGLMMDCDTTGIEPDLGLAKTKKLVGGGTMSIVNQTVPRALRRLGYSEEQISDIVAYIDEHKSILGAPHLAAEHVAVFACSMGDNAIHYLGHVKMMGAVQPFISGAISKCVSGETLLPTSDGLVRIGSLHRGEARDTFRDEVLEVASLAGTQKTDAFYFGGQRETWKTTLRSGHHVLTTANHRFLVAGHEGLEWRRVDELAVGDWVAQQYGADLWSTLPARFDGFAPSSTIGRKDVRIPAEMTEELAFLLGAYASEGCSYWDGSISITNAAPGVIGRVVAAWRDLFGVQPRVVSKGRNGCPNVIVHSRTIAELFEYLGCGSRASDKRIPDAVLRSPKPMVLAFLQGLALDAYVTTATAPKWAICLDSPGLLDDLQAVLTNLGVVHGRITKHNKEYDKDFGEVYACGQHAQALLRLVPFMEPDKDEAAEQLLGMTFEPNRNTADVVPGILPYELYMLLPTGKSGRNGYGVRSEFAFLCDPRTRRVTRRTLERVAAVPGVSLPFWLRQVLEDNLHFSPVESVTFAGRREVFDVSVPATHAFVGNGIVNHNTVNMPEEATVEEVEQLHIDAWKLGLKAVAIYRDNCKVGQPLSMAKKGDKPASTPARTPAGTPAEVVEKIVEKIVTVKEPVREKLPRNRRSRTFEFRVADCKGFVTVGEYDDGRPGEIFIRISKMGSTLAGIMDAFAISVSYGLQYGVPLRAYVETLANYRFEPAGMTDDPDIRFASSIVDFIFRRLAVDYLSYEERAELGILTIGERSQPTLPGVDESVVETAIGHDVVPDPVSIPSAATLLDDDGELRPAQPEVRHADAPFCNTCGVQMIRSGSCHACPSCGSTSGCS